MTIVPILVSVLVFVAVVLVGFMVVQRRDAADKRASLDLLETYTSPVSGDAVHVSDRQQETSTTATLARTGERFMRSSGKERLQRQLTLAGESSPKSLQAAMAQKVTFAIVALLLGVLLGLVMGGIWWLLAPAGLIGGWFLPDLLAYNRGIKRDQELGLGLADALDLLNLCVESGLGFQSALAQVAQNVRGPIAEEFSLVLQEMQLGRSRADALTSMGTRTRNADVQRFVAALLQVDRVGIPVSSVLREQARDMRAKRFSRAREQAQKLPVKILAPLMLCFFPALFIIIIGPAAASIVSSLSGLS